MVELSEHLKRKRFKPTVLVDQVSQALSEAIIEGVIKGGDQLKETELVSQFGISRSPLREAFRDLENKGLVVITPWKGTSVKIVTRKDVEDNFPMRAVLEGLAARMAHKKMSSNDLKLMQKTLQQMRKAVTQNNVKKYHRHHIQFHETFINCSDNEVLIKTLKTLRMHNVWHQFSFKYYQEDLQTSLKGHESMFDLFKSKDVDEDKIDQTVKTHIMIAFDKFISYLEEQQEVK